MSGVKAEDLAPAVNTEVESTIGRNAPIGKGN